MRIVVLAGGLSSEREVSLISGREVALALQRQGHTVTLVDPAYGHDGVLTSTASLPHSVPNPLPQTTAVYLQILALSALQQADVVFIALHGRYGEDGLIQALLETADIPYTGSGVRASAVAIDKILSKRIFDGAGIPTPPWQVVSPSTANDPSALNRLFNDLPPPLVIKPADEGSTLGVTIIDTPDSATCAQAIAKAAQFSNAIIAEQYIPGRELTVGILGHHALPVVEIIPNNGFYDYEHKYQPGKTQYHCPADLTPHQEAQLQQIALEAHTALGCEVFSRVDFRLSPEGHIFCLEVNTIPGLTPLSLFPKAAQAAGIPFPQLCERIIEMSVKRFSKK